MSKLKNRTIFLVSAVFLSLLTSVMLPLYNNSFLSFLSELGINLLVIVTGIVLVLTSLQYFIKGKFANKWSWLFLIPIFAITFSLAFYSFDILNLPLFALLILLLFIYSFWAGMSKTFRVAIRQIFNREFSDFIDAFFKKFFGFVDNFINPKDSKTKKEKIDKKGFRISPTVWKVIIGLIVAFPLFIIFAALFSSADAVFSNLMESIFDFFFNIIDAILELFAIENIWTLILWFVRFGFLFVLLYAFLRLHLGPRIFPKKSYYLKSNTNVVKKKSKQDDHVIAITILSVLNLLFMTFIAVQLFVLFAGHGIIEKLNITYSDYVHQGFNQLAVATGLVLGISLLMQLADRNNKSKLLRYLNIILLMQTIVIAASALKRILLYIDAYGLSRLRFTVQHFIFFTFVILILMIITLLRKKRLFHFVSYSFIITVLYLSAVSVFNIEAHIAQTNINRYLQDQSQALDIAYLSKFNTDITEQMNILEGMYKQVVDQDLCSDIQVIDDNYSLRKVNDNNIEFASMSLDNKNKICLWGDDILNWKEKNISKIKMKLDIPVLSSLNQQTVMNNKKHWVNLSVSDIKFLMELLDK